MESELLKGDILVIEANDTNHGQLKTILELEGYGVRSAAIRKTALDSIARKLPDLIIIDTAVPGMDTFEFCRRLRGNPATSALPVIFLGGKDEKGSLLEAFDAGCIDFLTRPFVKEELLARVNVQRRLQVVHRELEAVNKELTREVEAHRLAEEASVESSFRLFQILQMVSVPTFVIDMSHNITHWNNAMERMTGLSAVEMIGTRYHWRHFCQTERFTLADIIVENGGDSAVVDLYGSNYRRSSLIEGAYEVEAFFSSPDGTGKWFYLTAAPLVDSFGRAIGAIETVQDITERKVAETELKESEQRYMEMSITDSLTKLHNSRHFFRQLSYEVKRSRRYKKPLSLVLMDIDNFKAYNDTYGHPEGDLVLKALAATVRSSLRESDRAFRYGGEEFTVILPETDGESALQVAERLRANFEKVALNPAAGVEVHMTVSIGVSSYLNGETADTFLKRVDEAMYTAKNGGKNRVCFNPSRDQAVKPVKTLRMPGHLPRVPESCDGR